MKTMTCFAACGACLCVAGALALGGESKILFEASLDRGATWRREVTAMPGAEVSIRMRFQYESTTTVLGFWGITMQPVVNGWGAGDTILPFDFDLPRNAPESAYGRVYPFKRFSTTPPTPIDPPLDDPSRDWIAVDNGSGELRLTSRRNLTEAGLSWGLNFGQAPPTLNTTFATSLDLVVFRYGFVVSGGEREMVATAPLRYINNARMVWFTTPAGTGPHLSPLGEEDILGATVHVVPGAGVVALAWASVWCVRRRRASG